MIELNTIHCGNCQTVMHDIDSDSVDCIVTDPPYGMSFMGKNWDKAVPSVEIWQECLRVLKSGAFTFVMCIPRQDCLARMICRLEDAGFNVSFSGIYHTFASGFPKSQNIGKAVDKRLGAKREVIRKGFIKSYMQGTTYGKGLNASFQDRELTAASTPQAKALDGAYGGFQPKPAVEVIIVAMKPLKEKTYVDQALSNGHGCTWLDDCRIPFESERDKGDVDRFKGVSMLPPEKGFNQNRVIIDVEVGYKGGRFPANVICEDDMLDDGFTRKTGNTKPHLRVPSLFCACDVCTSSHNGDAGSYSRYFSLDAWFEERIKSLPEEAQKTFPFMIVPKASKGEKDRGCANLEGITRFASKNESGAMLPSKDNDPHKIKGNYHPTCKPIKLMSWLITLASCEGDTVLDPFCGSGTTAIAAKMLGRQYIGIEREEDYCEIARKRVSAISTNLSRF